MRSKIFISFGCILLSVALALTVYNLYDDTRAAEKAVEAVNKLQAEMPSLRYDSDDENSVLSSDLPAYVLNPEMEMPIKKIDGIEYIGTLEIPALGLVLPVISELTDYSLKMAPSRYKGSLYMGDLIIGAHNYRSHFSNLGNLPIGSDVIFTDVDGNVFSFVSVITETLRPTDIEEMESGEWDLTLFTCTFGGQYRITVRCEKAKK